jgi:hypothetical protein
LVIKPTRANDRQDVVEGNLLLVEEHVGGFRRNGSCDVVEQSLVWPVAPEQYLLHDWKSGTTVESAV